MKKRNHQPNRRHATVLGQICQLIPTHLVAKLARETGAADKARTFTPWSHVVAMLLAQVSHATSLNDVCDALRLHGTALWGIRAARPPARNTLSHANRVRDCALAEALFWAMLRHLQSAFPGFGRGGRRKLGWRFRRAIHAVDSTTIQLVANCLDWAKHRRRKAAAKCHLRLDLRSFLPSFALVKEAGPHDNTHARELCAGLHEGEIALFDKAYVDFEHLHDLSERGIWWVTRAKDDLRYRVQQRLPLPADSRILSDELIVPTGARSACGYPGVLRRVRAHVEIDGEEREVVFLSNHLEWAASSVVELYGCRWQIETFFKELKQSVQLVDFLGHSANAVKWQVWTALLVHLLLRFLAWRSRWSHSFSRIVTYLRAALWLERDLDELLRRCGTADGHFHWLGTPQQRWLPGFDLEPVGQHP